MERQMDENASFIKPDKLFRLEVCSFCNFRCHFCCWENRYVNSSFLQLPAGGARIITEALVHSGCYNVNITGGEPLLLPREYLCAVIREIQSVDGVRQLWITSNGLALTDRTLCENLYSAGLTDLAVSIAAETDQNYMRYTRTHTTLSDIIKGIQIAENCGLRIRVHVPLNPVGIASYKQLIKLIERLTETNVTTVSYFQLHNSNKIAHEYGELHIDPNTVTVGFSESPKWKFDFSGRPFYTNGRIKVLVPRESIQLVTENCKSQNCDAFCQGIYSAYMVPYGEGWALRACHRVFFDHRNEYPFDSRLLEKKSEELTELLHHVWRYAYDK